MRPTDEQEDAIGLFLAGRALAIEAGAGTGKTTTLRLLAEGTRKRGTYCAFNRSTVDEAKAKMPRNVSAFTAHGLAFRTVGKRYAHRLGAPRMRSFDLARLLGVDPFTIVYGSQRKVLQPSFLAGHVMRAVRTFCATADPDLGPEHIPYIDGIDLPEGDGARTYANNREVRRLLEPCLRRAWLDLSREDGALPFSHDVYLKLWQLGDPLIPGDFILFDEAQDASPVMLDAVQAQAARGVQLVFVGDSQQQIYTWRGAVNALASVPADDRTFLTQSWRFGPAIAEAANACLAALEAPLRLKGTPTISSRLGELGDHAKAVLCRTNARSVEEMLAALRAQRRPHLIGGGGEVLAFARAADTLKRGDRTYYPDLACFESWGEVQDYVEQDPQGGDLKLLVGLVDDYGVDVILGALEGQPAERSADVVISTAHKAKGREWPTVRLASDFPEVHEPDLPEATRLAYVAVTRAMNVLDCEDAHIVADLLPGGRERLERTRLAEARAKAGG